MLLLVNIAEMVERHFFRPEDLVELRHLLFRHHHAWAEAFGEDTLTSNCHKILHLEEQIRTQGTVANQSVGKSMC